MPTSWPVKPAAIVASVGLHAFVLAGAGWLVGTVQPENAPAKRLDISLVPAHVSTTQIKQHNVKRTKASSATHVKTNKTATQPKTKSVRVADAPPESAQPAVIPNQESRSETPKQAPAEITTATHVHLSAQQVASNRKPVYPRLSRRLGEEGIVILKVFVTAEGRAGQVQLHNSSGHPLLDESALLTVRTWRFQPAAINGQPIAEWYQLPIPFMLLDHS